MVAPATLSLLWKNPAELVDRGLNKVDALRDRQHHGTHDRAVVRQVARERFGYEPAEDPAAALADFLGGVDTEGFLEVWSDIEQRLYRAGHGLDGDVSLAAATWAAVRALRPEAVVETGVSRGVVTRVILEAMDRNGAGRLYSIDLPPNDVDPSDHAGAVVSRERWTFLQGSSRRHLPRLLRELGTIDVFLHDSQHTERNMHFELMTARRHIRPGGLLMSDDIHENAAWRDAAAGLEQVIVQERKAGMFAVGRV